MAAILLYQLLWLRSMWIDFRALEGKHIALAEMAISEMAYHAYKKYITERELEQKQ